jgi:hypothetical protein
MLGAYLTAAIRILPVLHSLHVANKVYYEWIAFAEDNFFDVLDIPLLEGDKATTLIGTRSVLVSKEMALKYFGSQ